MSTRSTPEACLKTGDTYPKPNTAAIQAAGVTHETTTANCEIWCDVTGAKRQARLLWREDMAQGVVVEGPALICEHQTTTLVAADFRSYADKWGNLVVEKIN